MPIPGPLTRQEHRILGHMFQRPGSDYYALEISKAVGVPARRLYPILNMFERRGWLEGAWERAEASSGSSRRRYYRLTLAGKSVGKNLDFAEHGELIAVGAPGLT